MLGSPHGLMFSRFIVDIAEALRSGMTDNGITKWYSQPKRGRNNPFDARLNCRIDEYLPFNMSSTHYFMGGCRAHSLL